MSDEIQSPAKKMYDQVIEWQKQGVTDGKFDLSNKEYMQLSLDWRLRYDYIRREKWEEPHEDGRVGEFFNFPVYVIKDKSEAS